MLEVQSGTADFEAILVYDVSRWGRFQDADEGAYYEHVCSRATHKTSTIKPNEKGANHAHVIGGRAEGDGG